MCFVLVAHHNQELRGVGDLRITVQNYVLRIREFLFDNPWVSANDRVRRQLLPTSDEVETMSFHESFVQDFEEFREGTSWMMQGGTRFGGTPDLTIQPDVPMVAEEKENFDA
jgi:hypothetical protein